jgi:L-fuconolactonase
MIVDAHFHIWQLARGDYGWLDSATHPVLAPIVRDFSMLQWRSKAAPLGVAGGVLVQAAPSEAETQFLLEQAEADASVLGVVGWVDWFAPDVRSRIHQLAAYPKLKGLRPMLHDLPDPTWVLQAALAPALEAMSECRLVFDALVRPVHLRHLFTLSQRYPDLRIVVDHIGKPSMGDGSWHPWADDLAQLAAATGAMCKLSGLLTEAGPRQSLSDVRRYGAHALECFGPARTVWGSDWPVLELTGTYRDWWRETRTLLAHCSAAERQAVMGGNAVRLYRL